MVTALLVPNSPTMRLADSAADGMAGTRITLERGGPEIATVIRCWVEARGLVGEIEFDDPALESVVGIPIGGLSLENPPPWP